MLCSMEYLDTVARSQSVLVSSPETKGTEAQWHRTLHADPVAVLEEFWFEPKPSRKDRDELRSCWALFKFCCSLVSQGAVLHGERGDLPAGRRPSGSCLHPFLPSHPDASRRCRVDLLCVSHPFSRRPILGLRPPTRRRRSFGFGSRRLTSTVRWFQVVPFPSMRVYSLMCLFQTRPVIRSFWRCTAAPRSRRSASWSATQTGCRSGASR